MILLSFGEFYDSFKNSKKNLLHIQIVTFLLRWMQPPT